MLAAREERALRQRELREQYGGTLVSLSLNIPGPHKTFPLARRSFTEMVRIFTLTMEAQHIRIIHAESQEKGTGDTAYVVLAEDAAVVKVAACAIENTHPLGRVFDIDVFDPSGNKLSRRDFGGEDRGCFVCGANAFVCGRSRAHSEEELLGAVNAIMLDYLGEKAGDMVLSAAAAALLDEVAVSPKPGLVDRLHNGAHQDMDFFTFIDSTAAILPFFRECAIRGFESREDPRALFESLRQKGKIAELCMTRASGGANTHRGLIFSLGILSAAWGRLFRSNATVSLETLLALCRDMASHVEEDFSRRGEELSHGETVYACHGLKGARGEAAQGFPTVRDVSWPVLCRTLAENYSYNDAGLVVLLHLLAHTDDTNIVHRSGISALRDIQEKIKEFLAENPDINAMRHLIIDLDRQFTARNISPGGCADLLAITFFLHRLLNRC
jgi:holo-ACP synthase/triphosphoribosyl-dephospho-CoA synthase